MPGATRWRSQEVIKKAMDAGLITSKTIDDRARAVLRLLEKTGKFADRRIQEEEKAIDLPEHRALIREAGAEGIVLLKNDNATLPLDIGKCKRVALLGPLAKYPAAHGGGSASLNAHYKVSPYEAFEKRLSSEVELTYSKGMTTGIYSRSSADTKQELTSIACIRTSRPGLQTKKITKALSQNIS